jgi:hypothetical protein
MSRHEKTRALINVAIEVLREHHPMTLRQVYYQLVSRQVVEKSRNSYQAVGRALVGARQDRAIPWDWIEDRLRKPRHVSMWDNLDNFVETALFSYRRNIWATQPRYFETWLEKDALSGIFEETLEPYGVTLNVGRGFDGWTSIRDAAGRYMDHPGITTILYAGDFDPSGEDMVRSLGERLEWFGAHVDILKIAIGREDIDRYGLPPDFTKATDSRRAGFIAKHGDIPVELDALPTEVLRQRIVDHIEKLIDLDALASTRGQETAEREWLRQIIGASP